MIIRTPRLTLTPLVASDTDGIHRMRGHDEVMKWSYRGHAETPSETTEWVTNVLTSPSPWICFSVRERRSPSDTIVGSIGVRLIHDRLSPDADPLKRWELGYIFHPEAWGKGYATEAIRGVVQGWNGAAGIREWTVKMWKETNEQNQRGDAVVQDEGEVEVEEQVEVDGEGVQHEVIWAMTNSDNEGSKRVLVKNGFACVGDFVDVKGIGCLIYKIEVV